MGLRLNHTHSQFGTLLCQLLAALLSLAIAVPAFASTYDAVGNRTQKVSTPREFPSGLSNYNANDQLTTDAGVYPERSRRDADGNTVGSGANTGTTGYVYDFENRLIQQGGISIVYDGNGNRRQKTVAGVTTIYWVAEQNPTGYAQVTQEEASNGAPLEQYVYGLEQIARLQVNGTPPTVYYVYDGHGSVRALTDQTGAVTDTYDYDAFGNLIHSTGTTPNNYLFAGEQFDPDLNLYYNRARYLNTSTGRFWSMDTDEGDDESPISLHKYLYASAEPVNRVDPSGNESAAQAIGTANFSLQLDLRTAFEIVKTGAKVLALACTVAVGIAAVAGGGACGINFNEMRVQLQVKKINVFSLPVRAPEYPGVTVLQVSTALLGIYTAIYAEQLVEDKLFPKNAPGAEFGLFGAVIRTGQKLIQIQRAGGVVQGGNVTREEFDVRGRTYRVDVENLRGDNLRFFGIPGLQD